MRRDSDCDCDCDDVVTSLHCLHLLRHQSPSTCVTGSQSPVVVVAVDDCGGGGEEDANDVDDGADRSRPESANVVRRIGTVEQSVTRTDRRVNMREGREKADVSSLCRGSEA